MRQYLAPYKVDDGQVLSIRTDPLAVDRRGRAWARDLHAPIYTFNIVRPNALSIA